MADLEYIVLNGEKLSIKDNRLNNLAVVATTGSYNDLKDKPTIPTSYNDLTDKPTIPTITYDMSMNQITIVTE